MKRNVWTSTLLWAALGLLVVVFVPFLLPNNYWLGVFTFVAIFTILAVGLNLLMGYAGQVSLGHAAFYGIGAYTSAILTAHPAFVERGIHISPWLAMPIGMLLTSLVALLIGLPCLRLRGHYLAMATLGFGWIVFMLMIHWDTLSMGPSGIEKIPKLVVPVSLTITGTPYEGLFHRLSPRDVAAAPVADVLPAPGPDGITTLGGAIDNDVERFYLTWLAALLILVLSANVVNSRLGRALRALHSSESAAATLGVNVAHAKVVVFVLAAAFASLAGSLYAHTVNFISPSVFGFVVSVELVVMVVIGGMASVWGSFIGATAITLLAEWLRNLGELTVEQLTHGLAKGTSQPLKESDVIVHGLILMLVMIFMPTGLVVGVRDLVLRLVRRRRKAAATAEAPKEGAPV